jgi:hypothetical protein
LSIAGEDYEEGSLCCFPLQLIEHEPELSQHALFRRSCPHQIDVTLKIETQIVRHVLSADSFDLSQSCVVVLLERFVCHVLPSSHHSCSRRYSMQATRKAHHIQAALLHRDHRGFGAIRGQIKIHARHNAQARTSCHRRLDAVWQFIGLEL